MKWFKHLSDASDNDFIEEIELNFGLEGYARWWKLLEIIARGMDETDKCYAEHSWQKWQFFLKGKRKKLEEFLKYLEEKGKIKLVHSGLVSGSFKEPTRNQLSSHQKQSRNILKIICPKLLELRDNQTRNLQASGKSLAQNLPLDLEAEKKESLNLLPLTPSQPVDNLKPEKIIPPKIKTFPGKEKILIYDFEAAAAACCSVLQRRMLSPTDNQILLTWLKIHPFKEFILPIIVKKTKNFITKNHGDTPASLSYFEPAINEGAPRPG